MKVTPLEIRQKTFERTLRGYDKDEVNAFLLSLSQEWERMMDEVKDLRVKLEASEREVAKLREVETSLFKTLKTAEDTGANVIEQANKAAELHLREAQMSAEAILNEARDKARNVLEDAELTSRQLLVDMEDNLKELAQQYKTLETHRNNLLDDLKRLAQEVIDRAGRADQTNRFNVDEHLSQAKRESKKLILPSEQESRRLRVPVSAPTPVSAPVQQTPAPPAEPLRSFFDEVA
ncbi:MAG: DivIVA domain-containing protein [Cyclobacteriaceae bacterium]|nr:DivIVA domain-containing protein [Cyclobacteriaceae bacterium]